MFGLPETEQDPYATLAALYSAGNLNNFDPTHPIFQGIGLETPSGQVLRAPVFLTPQGQQRADLINDVRGASRDLLRQYLGIGGSGATGFGGGPPGAPPATMPPRVSTAELRTAARRGPPPLPPLPGLRDLPPMPGRPSIRTFESPDRVGPRASPRDVQELPPLPGHAGPGYIGDRVRGVRTGPTLGPADDAASDPLIAALLGRLRR